MLLCCAEDDEDEDDDAYSQGSDEFEPDDDDDDDHDHEEEKSERHRPASGKPQPRVTRPTRTQERGVGDSSVGGGWEFCPSAVEDAGGLLYDGLEESVLSTR